MIAGNQLTVEQEKIPLQSNPVFLDLNDATIMDSAPTFKKRKRPQGTVVSTIASNSTPSASAIDAVADSADANENGEDEDEQEIDSTTYVHLLCKISAALLLTRSMQ